MFDPVDVAVGRRIRVRRMFKGMSQKGLGQELGVTFQQVQKYEKGANRVGAGRLFRIAKILEVSISFFFEDVAKTPELLVGEVQEESALPIHSGITTPYMEEAAELVRFFDQIPDKCIRRQLISLAQTLSRSTKNAS